jgi:triosephosphate isomerase
MTVLVGTSWKMNLTTSQAEHWLEVFVAGVADVTDVAGVTGVELFVLPPFTSISVARSRLEGTGIAWGAQDVHPADSGAHTGDVSAPMLAELGCTWVEVGHHERRRDHGDTPDRIAAKVAAVLRHGMRPILCVGETQPMSVAQATAEVIEDLERCLGAFQPREVARVVVAYEPVWAIGEGATPAGADQVGSLHRSIHEWLRRRSDGEGRVIYGGSVDELVAPDLLREPGVDGLFVGRRALDPEAFVSLVRSCAGAGDPSRQTPHLSKTSTSGGGR